MLTLSLSPEDQRRLFAQVVRAKLARGETVIPALTDWLDTNMPGWREESYT
jgi:hypothetical protein